MKIATIVGARPQFIKTAAVSRLLRQQPGVTEILIHTGQHYDAQMSDVFFAEMRIPQPDHHLGIGGGSHGAQTGQMLEKIERVLIDQAPDWVLVYGDTNSTLAGALAAAKLSQPIAHVEAGLRSFNRRMPEEINRVVTDHLCNLAFAPTAAAVANLAAEGIDGDRVRQVGDVMYDAVRFYAEQAGRHGNIVERLGLPPRGFVLSTIHRAENTDDPRRLATIADALALIARSRPVVLPLHPRTAKALAALGLRDRLAAVTVIEPVGYFDMLALEQAAGLVVTDSGGVQKEAFFSATPCLTLRDETEWVELVELGWNRLCPPALGAEAIAAAAEMAGRSGRDGQPYGDGHAAEAIVAALLL